MIPNDLNPNTFYRSFNDHAQIYGEARALQSQMVLKAFGALRRAIVAAWRSRQAARHDHGGAHPTAA